MGFTWDYPNILHHCNIFRMMSQSVTEKKELWAIDLIKSVRIWRHQKWGYRDTPNSWMVFLMEDRIIGWFGPQEISIVENPKIVAAALDQASPPSMTPNSMTLQDTLQTRIQKRRHWEQVQPKPWRCQTLEIWALKYMCLKSMKTVFSFPGRSHDSPDRFR